MEKAYLFFILSIPVFILSRRNLINPGSHGFYRFLSWECIIWLFVSCYKNWFDDPFSFRQIISWAFLIISLYLVIAGVFWLRKKGNSTTKRDEKALYDFEKTSELVTQGIFRYIRHPMYSSLLFLTWGIYLKNPTLLLLIPAVFSSIFLYITALCDEKECIRYFGKEYREYMKVSKRFVPFVY